MTPIRTILDVESVITYAPAMLRARWIVGLTIILACALFSYAESNGAAENFAKYYKDVQYFGIPEEGSSAERRILEYVAAKARSLGFAVRWQAIAKEGEYHSFAADLQITVPGGSAKAVAVAFPVDAKPKGDGDPFATPAAACLFLDALAGRRLEQSVSVNLLSAEDGVSPGLGGRSLIAGLSRSQTAGVVCADLHSAGAEWEFIHGTGGRVSPAWLLDMSLKAFSLHRLPVDINTIDSQLYRLGVADEGMLAPFLKAGLPSIQFRPRPGPGGDPAVRAAELAAVLLDVTQAPIFLEAGPYDWDANYLYLNLDRPRIVGEHTIAVLFLALMAVYLLLMFAKRRDRIRYLKSLLRGAPWLAAISAAAFAVFVAAAVASRWLIPDYSLDPAYGGSMVWFFGGRFFAGVALLMLGTRLLWRFLPHQSSFFGAAAMFSALVGLLVIAALSLTLSIYMLFCTLFLSLANLTRPRGLKVAFFALAGLVLLQPAFEALRLHPGRELDALLLHQLFPGTILVAILSLPFVFMWIRLLLFMPYHRPWVRRLDLAVVVAMAAAAAACFAVGGVRVHLMADGLADLRIEHRYDQSSGGNAIVVSGGALLPPGDIVYAGSPHRLPFGAGQSSFALDRPPDRLPTIEKKSSEFLGRKTTSIALSSARPLLDYQLRFHADRELVVHSLNFPFRYIDAKTIEILIGANPPQSLTLEMTVPSDVAGVLSLTADMPELFVFKADRAGPKGVPGTFSYHVDIPWD